MANKNCSTDCHPTLTVKTTAKSMPLTVLISPETWKVKVLSLPPLQLQGLEVTFVRMTGCRKKKTIATLLHGGLTKEGGEYTTQTQRTESSRFFLGCMAT